MLVDLSWSMALRGSFQAAKKVSLALHNLITSQYPKDTFYIIGFAAYAKELKPVDLPFLQWDEYVLGTNMQHALLLAEKLLAKHNSGTKQIIMISDGEPTAHLENGHAQFAYPPTRETIRATMRAVRLCTQKNIAINTFMLDANYYLKAFMDGTLGSRTALMLDGTGVEITTREELADIIRRGAAAGWPVAVHAIGDRANRNALDAFRETRDLWMPLGLRQRIEHAQCLDPEGGAHVGREGGPRALQIAAREEPQDAFAGGQRRVAGRGGGGCRQRR